MKKPKRPYRVSCTRYYIAVQTVDVMASNPAEAARKAKLAAQKVKPDPRKEAVDNHWQTEDEPIEIPKIGCGAGAPYPQTEVHKGVFVFD